MRLPISPPAHGPENGWAQNAAWLFGQPLDSCAAIGQFCSFASRAYPEPAAYIAGNANKVKAVATISPPMMATARGPKHAARQRDHGQDRSGSGQHDGAEPAHGGIHDGRPGWYALARPVRSGQSGSPSCADHAHQGDHPSRPQNQTVPRHQQGKATRQCPWGQSGTPAWRD